MPVDYLDKSMINTGQGFLLWYGLAFSSCMLQMHWLWLDPVPWSTAYLPNFVLHQSLLIRYGISLSLNMLVLQNVLHPLRTVIVTNCSWGHPIHLLELPGPVIPSTSFEQHGLHVLNGVSPLCTADLTLATTVRCLYGTGETRC